MASKCKKCESVLNFEDGVLICPKCGTKYEVPQKGDKELKEIKDENQKENSEVVDKSTPEFIAKKSIKSLTGWIIFGIIGCVLLLVPTIVMIVKIIKLKTYKVKFYVDRIEIEKGVFVKETHQALRTGILTVNITQNVWARICNYGTIKIDQIGTEGDFIITDIENPMEIKKYLEKSLADPKTLRKIVAE